MMYFKDNNDGTYIADVGADGWTEITKAEYDVLNPPQPPVIPSIVTMRQARLALLGAGLLNNVTTAINALPSPQKEAAQIEWEYSQEVHRDKPFVAVLAGALGLTDAQLDDLFLTASTL